MSYTARMTLFVLLAISIMGGAGIGFYHYWLDQAKPVESSADMTIEAENEEVKVIETDESETGVVGVVESDSSDVDSVTPVDNQGENKQALRASQKHEKTDAIPVVPGEDTASSSSISYGDDSTRIIVEDGVELEGLDVKAELHNKVIKDDEVIQMKP
ncbi:hypothetical protein [Zooshikella harenae]|uniref:LPS export ABC transporter periplasmic protein LptC n=1 Tax=Zooshikella harenae TaxID=2827238 RepID=A0ABS5ZCP8_9GAMM|nr:hypothetical protein [Zooshikella harenae]MBU2711836.1 hypothetical protein [Zooshikella harenae]